MIRYTGAAKRHFSWLSSFFHQANVSLTLIFLYFCCLIYAATRKGTHSVIDRGNEFRSVIFHEFEILAKPASIWVGVDSVGQSRSRSHPKTHRLRSPGCEHIWPKVKGIFSRRYKSQYNIFYESCCLTVCVSTRQTHWYWFRTSSIINRLSTKKCVTWDDLRGTSKRNSTQNINVCR